MDIKDVIGTGEAGKEIVKQTSELVKEPVHNVVNPSSKTIGERLSSVFDLVFTPIEMLQIYKDHKIDKFRNKLKDEIDAIPEDKKITPNLNIIGPAIEAAKYHIDDDGLRDMFAKLIAGAMNSDLVNITHPAFVEIIKQLSPFDAKNIAGFKNEIQLPIVDYVTKAHVKYPLVPNVVLGLSDCKDIYMISSSITNLIRAC